MYQNCLLLLKGPTTFVVSFKEEIEKIKDFPQKGL